MDRQRYPWLHFYLSMASFATVFFFGATGVTMNHPDWFAHQDVTRAQGRLRPEWLAGKVPATLEVVEFRIDGGQCLISFQGPGYMASAFASCATGVYEITITGMGAVAVLNDLHKGRDSGKVWSAVINASGAVLVLVSGTGMVLPWFVHRRRLSGYLVAAAGLSASVLLHRLFVP